MIDGAAFRDLLAGPSELLGSIFYAAERGEIPCNRLIREIRLGTMRTLRLLLQKSPIFLRDLKRHGLR